MPDLWIATDPTLPDLSPDHQRALAPLLALGLDARVARWDDPTIAWHDAKLVWIASCWGYFARLREFMAWLDHLDLCGATVANPTRLIRWNLNKRYLLELRDAGVPIIPTCWVEDPAYLDAALSQLAALGWHEVVIKPAVSAGAFKTTRSRGVDDARAALRAIAGHSEALIQPLREAILARGEWSLICLNGAFSHAVRKVPARGDFRVQDDFHGQVHFEPNPPQSLIDAAHHALSHCPEPAPLYARVDGIWREDAGFELMELELIEPELFLRAHPDAPERLAHALAARLI